MARQADLSEDFEKLRALLFKKSKLPFDRLNEREMEELVDCCSSFRQGGHWQIGEYSNNRYFYRIENLESFLAKHDDIFYKDLAVPGTILINTSTNSARDIFSLLVKKYTKGEKNWQPLEKLTPGYLSRRGFSWWTNDFNFDTQGKFPSGFIGNQLTADNRWLLDFAFNVGICSDWLSEYILFLRLDSDQVDRENIRIPSIIDAFTQPIFSPQAFQENRRWGLAFDLNKEVKPFYREFVLKNIPVTAVEYLPIRINLAALNDINPRARLNEVLVQAMIQNI